VTTAEITTTTEAKARRLTTRIKLVFGSMLDQHDKLVELVEEAKTTSAHVALGYPSWPAYVSAEFGELQARLGIDDRRVLVGALTATGLPTQPPIRRSVQRSGRARKPDEDSAPNGRAPP